MKLHLWELYDIDKISVDIKKTFKNKLRNLIRYNIFEIAKELDIFPVRLYDYFIYQNLPIPLNVLIKISRKFGINLDETETNIVMYKQMFVPNKTSIKNPRLPIKICPYFTSIIAHLYFDGSVPKDGKGTYYNQKNKQIMDDFISKIKKVFGDVYYFVKKDHRGVLKCRVPRIVGEISKKVYNIKSFGTFDSKLSKIIFNLPKEHKASFVLTAILDEGSIAYDGTIFFGVSNKQLCNDVAILCKEIGLEISNVKKTKQNHYYIYIKSKQKFLSLINKMSKKYPLINLRYKKKRLEHYVEIKKHPGLRTKKGGDRRKKDILSSLINPKTINILSKELLIHPRTLRRHMYKLMDKNKVTRMKKGREYFYYLTIPH